eukprot:CAMPEP_0202440372 /NCGR_PEP_ID=MMETSP1345-20130828/36658_1 /ASSEMBLY_ACC=CAM_ASM_000843 /TAXON_ID=342563 /ORGANISM="Fabrea Fabrea salina" /LENGTH=50 /DNA_ID=CAMNT_0049054961 /DNA_START=2011 /DNA_END=2163 /DNA_ORIENTATION=+
MNLFGTPKKKTPFQVTGGTEKTLSGFQEETLNTQGIGSTDSSCSKETSIF